MASVKDHILNFNRYDRGQWLREITRGLSIETGPNDSVCLNIRGLCDISKLEPLHLVTLACLVEFYSCEVLIDYDENESSVRDYIIEKIDLIKYFSSGERVNYIAAKEDTLFNLWRIKKEEIDPHSQRITDYLNRKFFKNKDLSAVKNSLLEAYQNIFDHADAGDKAFSFIMYDEKNVKLKVAVCDLGVGIPTNVKRDRSELKDWQALELAMQEKFSTQSQIHNRGYGLSNIRQGCTDGDNMRIFSRNGLLFVTRDNIKGYEIDFCFPGTLLYYEVSLDHLDDLEIVESFSFGDI